MKHVINLIRGAFIGVANAVPGVSGGTIAVITGIYDRLLASISHFVKGGEGGWRKNIIFLLPILLGVAIGLVGFSFVIVWGRSTVPVQLSLLFAGLIVGSLPYLLKIANRNGFNALYLIPFILGAALVVLLSLLNRAPEGEPMRSFDFLQGLAFFGASVLGMSAMVVPGISGSFVLLLLGAYTTFITAIKEFNLPLLVVFGLGSIIGLLLISRLLNVLLDKFHSWTYWGILGLVLGSVFDVILRAISPNSMALSTANLVDFNIPLAVAAFVIGLVGALALSGEKKAEHQNQSTKGHM